MGVSGAGSIEPDHPIHYNTSIPGVWVLPYLTSEVIRKQHTTHSHIALQRLISISSYIGQSKLICHFDLAQ
jgi:hypothetical protein